MKREFKSCWSCLYADTPDCPKVYLRPYVNPSLEAASCSDCCHNTGTCVTCYYFMRIQCPESDDHACIMS